MGAFIGASRAWPVIYPSLFFLLRVVPESIARKTVLPPCKILGFAELTEPIIGEDIDIWGGRGLVSAVLRGSGGPGQF